MAHRYSWPGNLRELENVVKRYLILGDEALVLSELERGGTGAAPSTGATSTPATHYPGDLKRLVRNLKDGAEKEAITRALEQTNWSRRQAARVLNISYKALLYKIRQYEIDQQ
jgi:DNA-binding NtrC family response regulator